jgi:hypothetical protein
MLSKPDSPQRTQNSVEPHLTVESALPGRRENQYRARASAHQWIFDEDSLACGTDCCLLQSKQMSRMYPAVTSVDEYQQDQ